MSTVNYISAADELLIAIFVAVCVHVQPMGGPYSQAPMMQGGMYPNPNANMYGAPNPHHAMGNPNMMGMPQNPGNPMMSMGYPPAQQQQQQYGYPAPGQGAQPYRY